MLQAATVAVSSSSIMSYAIKRRLESQPGIAEVWLDGSLGDRDGLPGRKTRIYIPADQAQPGGDITVVNTRLTDSEAAPAKKKRKGKAERNRIKKEQEKALGSDTTAVRPAIST